MRRLPTFLHAGEPEALLAAAEGARDRLIVQVGILLGLRVSEITALQIPHLDLIKGQAFVSQGKGKKDRYVPIPSKLTEELGTWIGARIDGYLFPSPRGGGRLSGRAIQKLMKRLAQKANLPGAAEPRRYNPHKLRHNYASRLLETGADIKVISELLGHSDISTTQIYLHTSDERKRQACERL